jgi:hypothetical protein
MDGSNYTFPKIFSLSGSSESHRELRTNRSCCEGILHVGLKKMKNKVLIKVCVAQEHSHIHTTPLPHLSTNASACPSVGSELQCCKSSLVFCQLYLYAALILVTLNPLAFGRAKHDPPKISVPKTWFSSKSAFVCKLIHHPRYDVNVYHESYSKNFPNVSATHEMFRRLNDLWLTCCHRSYSLVLPRGFLHSYNVVLDSYQWEEDFSEWSKLTGSMVYWWMNDPPFDTSFIQQKWTEGYEVDSFHTFHWYLLSSMSLLIFEY